MEEKYEENLWGQIDLLHQKSKRQQISFNYLLEMLKAFQEGFLEFSKVLQNILNKSHEIIEYHSTSIYDSAEKFVKSYEAMTKEFKEAYNNIKKQILDPVNKPTNEMFTKENELYKSYIKCRNQYNNSKSIIEKCYQNYENNMKFCENTIVNSKQIEILPYAGADEKKKNEKKANESIKSAKGIEDKYKNSIDNSNKARELEIQKQQELLQYYQKLDINFYEKVKSIFGLYLALNNKIIKNISSSLEFLGKSYQQIEIEKDINNFISNNKSEKKLQEISTFKPYVPFSDPTNKKEDANKLNISYEVLKILKNNFKDIRNDINMEEETKRRRLRFLSEKIFKFGNNISFLPEEKKELMSFLEIPSFREYFLIVLSKQRTKGRFKRSESLVRDLSDLLLKILEMAENEKDHESAKNCIILSQTYYFEQNIENKKKNDGKKEEVKKIYLFELIKNNKWLKSLEFWEGLIEKMIEREIKKTEEVGKKQGIEENEKTKNKRTSNICFSQLLTFSSNMMEFGLNKDDIVKTVDKYALKYGVSEELAATIYSTIEMKQQEISSNLINQENKNKETNEDINNKKEENKESNENKENIESKEINKEQIIDKNNKIIENNNNENDLKVKEVLPEQKEKNEIDNEKDKQPIEEENKQQNEIKEERKEEIKLIQRKRRLKN